MQYVDAWIKSYFNRGYLLQAIDKAIIATDDMHLICVGTGSVRLRTACRLSTSGAHVLVDTTTTNAAGINTSRMLLLWIVYWFRRRSTILKILSLIQLI